MLPNDVIYNILELLDIIDLRELRLVCKDWKKIIDEIRIIKLKERVYKYNLRKIFHRWTLFTILCINSRKNNNSWISKCKSEDREILLF